MRTKFYISGTLLIMMSLLSSCVPITKSYSKPNLPNLNIEGRRLGILPFYCEAASIGNTVSDSIGANLLDTGFIVIERTYLTNILEEQGLVLSGTTETVDYGKIGKLSNCRLPFNRNCNSRTTRKV